MKRTRMTLTTIALAAAILAFFFVPLPVTRVRERGVIEVQPESLDKVYVEVPAFLTRMHVQEGQHVRKGTVLAEFSSPELVFRRESALAQETIKGNLFKVYETYLTRTRDQREQQNLLEGRDRARKDLEEAKTELEEIKRDQAKLVLRAPRDGVVVGLPHTDEIGKKWDRDQSVPFCSIGDPTKLRVQTPIATSDYSLIKEEIKRNPFRPVPVTLRVQGRGSRLWKGHVEVMPSSEAKTIPPSLSSRGGGPIAVKPGGSDPNQMIPQNQVYLVGINIDNPDSAIVPGSMAHVKIHNHYRSAAWWVWRTISATFDLGLM